MTHDAELERVVRDALELCAVPAPPFGEAARASELARRLAAAGARPTHDEAGNVLARFGPADGPASMLVAHLDTVFPAGTRLDPRRDGDVLRGPGIGDDALGLAGLVHVARRLSAGEAVPNHAVLLAGTVGEEGVGDLRGARALLDAHTADAFVALEGHGLDTLQTAGIASQRLRARFRTDGGHSWSDRGAPSAVHALLESGAAAIRAARGAHVNVGVVRGGASVNTIASDASVDIDLRDADERALADTRARLERTLVDGTPPGAELTLEPLGRRPGGVTPRDHPLVRAARAARHAPGLPEVEEIASSTDANAALERGIPAISVGLTRGAHSHRLDEHVELAPLGQGLAALDALVDALAAGLPR